MIYNNNYLEMEQWHKIIFLSLLILKKNIKVSSDVMEKVTTISQGNQTIISFYCKVQSGAMVSGPVYSFGTL